MSAQSLEQILSSVGLAGAAGIWAAAWDESGASLPEGELFFLQRDWISATLGELAMPEEVIDAFHQGLDMFHRHPALSRLAWHCHHLLQAGIDKETHLKQWPTLPDLHPMAGMFYAYVVLAGLPHALRRHRERGIDPTVTRDTFGDLALWMQDYRQKHGRWGLSELHETGWLQDHLEARLFRLGRLQFRMEEFPCDLRVYRAADKARPVMLAGPGQVFRPDGRFDGVNDIRAGTEAWRSTLDVRDESVAGQAVDPRGFVRPAKVTLRHPGAPLLQQHDRILGIHIPAGGSLTLDASGESLRQAVRFFPRYFPEYIWRAFTSHTWLFDAQFEDYLPPESNIVRFLRQFYLYPLPDGDDRQTLERVCGRVYDRPADMPRATSLQRVVAGHMERGGRWYNTGGFLLREDVPHWGTDYYRG